WIYSVVLVQIICQLALAFSEIATMRVLARGAAFAVSLALLAMMLARRRRTKQHPAAPTAVLVVVILALSLLHPTTNSWLSGGVQAGLYVSILAPLFWVSRVGIDGAGFRKMVWLVWWLNATSAAGRGRQVNIPGRVLRRGVLGGPGLGAAASDGRRAGGSARVRRARRLHAGIVDRGRGSNGSPRHPRPGSSRRGLLPEPGPLPGVHDLRAAAGVS